MPEAADLVAHARATRVVVIGGGIAGLVAARACARVGLAVTVVEERERCGGAVSAADLGGVRVDTGIDGWTPSPAMETFVTELGLGARVVAAATDALWIVDAAHRGAVPVPADSVLGIPANPWDESVRRLIGWRGAWRAYLDRLRPPLTIGHERRLGALVRTRMGARVRDRIVAPVVRAELGAEPDEVDIEAAAPGLSTALTRTGSLAGAAAELSADRAARALSSIDGGMTLLVDALVDELSALGARIATGRPATALTRAGDAWLVALQSSPEVVVDDDSDAGPAVRTQAGASPEVDDDATPGSLAADLVIVATGEASARALLADAASLPPAATLRPRVDVVTLRVTAPALDGAPRGRTAVPLAADAAALRVVHATAAWPWLRGALDGDHVLRVTLRDRGDAAALDDADAIALARREASVALGVDLPEPHAAHRRRTSPVLPAAALGRAAATATVEAVVHRAPGLGVVGDWLSGAGVSDLVPAAVAEAERLRRRALWGEEAVP